MELDRCRKEIQQIDKSIAELFIKRMDVVSEIAKYKIANKLPVYDKKREEELIFINSQNVPEGLREYYIEVLHSIMDVSKKYQKNIIDK